MDARQLDIDAWGAVEGDLTRLLDATRGRIPATFVAPLLHRVAVVRLKRAVLEDPETAAEALTDEGEAGGPLERLSRQLDRQLAGESGAAPVLETLPAEVREAAEAALTDALEDDPLHFPSLRARAALAGAASRWPQVAECLERLVDQPGEAGGRAWQKLGDVHWRKLAAPKKARPCYIRARQVLGDETRLLDKMLKLDLELENWEEAIETCHALIDKMQRRKKRPELAVTYMLTMGEIHVYGMRQPKVALTYYLMAQSTLPEYELTYQLLQELLLGNDWEMLEPDLDLLPEASVELISPSLGRLRAVVEAHPGDAAGAIKAFRAG